MLVSWYMMGTVRKKRRCDCQSHLLCHVVSIFEPGQNEVNTGFTSMRLKRSTMLRRPTVYGCDLKKLGGRTQNQPYLQVEVQPFDHPS